MTPSERDALARDTLRWIMDCAQDGFYLLIAPPEVQRAEAGRYTARTGIYDYARRPEAYADKPYSFGELARWAEEQESGVLFVLNLQVVLRDGNDFSNLNLSRDMLAKTGRVWVFGVTGYMDKKLAQTARDFYAYMRLRARYAETATEARQAAFPENRYFASVEEAERALASYAELEARLLAEDGESLEDGQRLSIAVTLINIASVYKDYARYDRALALLERVKTIREKVLGLEHPDTAVTYNNIAVVYSNQGDYVKALEWYEKALAIDEKALRLEHPSTAATYNNMAWVYFEQGDYAKALEWHEKALAISEKVLGLEHPSTAVTYNNIALVYSNQGDYEKALEWYEKDLAISEKVLGIEHPDTATTYRNMADTYAAMGDEDRAAEYRAKANQNINSQEPAP